MRGIRRLLVTATCPVLLALVCATPALGAQAWWHVDLGSRPASIPAGGDGELVVSVENVGDAQAVGPVTVADVLPGGLRATGIITGSAPKRGGTLGETVALSCSLEHLSCEAPGPLAAYDAIEIRIGVEALPGAQGGEASTVSVSGGGAPSVRVSRRVSVGQPGGFGVEGYGLEAESEGGGPVTQAGAHPFQVTGSILLDQGEDAASFASAPDAGPAVPARDVVARLPPGLIANPSAVPRCLAWQFAESVGGGEQDRCPYQSAVGAASVTFDLGGVTRTVATPVFNIEPEPGEPARFGFYVPLEGVPVVLTTSVRSSEDWGVDLSSSELPQNSGISGVRVTFWGVAGSALHDDARGWGCLAEARGRNDVYEEAGCVHFEEREPPAFVTLPTSCTSSLASSLEADSWAAPGVFQSLQATEPLAPLTGCGNVPFSPTISTATTTGSASSPSGFSFDLTFSRQGLTSGTSIAQSNVEKTVVSLPEGLTIDPSAGVGLGACTPSQYAEVTLNSPEGAGCPEDSKLGTVEVETPLLFTTVYGSLYVAQPYDNPFPEPGHPGGSLIAVYVVAKSRAERGVIVKLAGRVAADPATGRLTVTFENDPPLQFDRFNFHFREGAQAALISPATCGSYTTSAELFPYSAPEDPLVDTASFQVTSGSEGSACPNGEPPFAPTITAGTLTNHAGTFSPLYVDLSRTDAMQYISSFSTVLPVGLTADLTGVPQCPQADVEAARAKTGTEEEQNPSCPEASLIGHSLVGTGVGAILDYVPGKLYLSGPFRGDPLSVVSVTSAVVGPFDLGTVVVRFGLHIDPYTAQVSIDPSGSEPIPTIIDGIVTHVRDIKVSIDRSNFTINPTACESRPISSTLASSLGAVAATSTPLQAENCDELAFKPTFKASTNGKTSRAAGASLTVKLTMPVKLGTQSNIRTVKVELPKQLPSRLTTLQKACTEAQFNANPAGCPPASFIGQARANTPILPVPLEGPAIFVSHGGEAFPSLILVLQGYGFTIDIVGATHISPQGITSTTFKTIPDEPVGSFQITIPQGNYSALTANANLCKLTRAIHVKQKEIRDVKGQRRRVTIKTSKRIAAKLVMPTLFIAQNGAKLKQDTKIEVTGCAKAKPAKKVKEKAKKASKKKAADGAAGAERPVSAMGSGGGE
ncbi:MAG TPA: hypothetical protein VNY52_12640 [Solirubrobacteraceae bacterium]|nr:hypothetical protein [Solirubrobacteraceae bacterium]